MRLRSLGLVFALLAVAMYLALVIPARRELAGLHAEYSKARVSREAKRLELRRLEAAHRAASSEGKEPVALALDLRPGLVTCLERAGLGSVELAFEGDAPEKLRFRLAATGGLSGILEGLDCLTSPDTGIVPDSVTISRSSSELRLALSAVTGRVTARASGFQPLSRSPFAEGGSVGSEPLGDHRTRPPELEPLAAAAPQPAPPEPEVRLVGLVERHGRFQAALAIRGEVVIATVGEVVAGYELSSIEPGSGVVVLDPNGTRISLPLLEVE